MSKTTVGRNIWPGVNGVKSELSKNSGGELPARRDLSIREMLLHIHVTMLQFN